MKRRLVFLLVSLLFIFSIMAFASALTANISMTKNSFYASNTLPSLTSFYAPLPVFFEGFRSSPRDSIINYAWDFGDGSKINGSGMFNAAHVYEVPGTYTAVLTVTDTTGATAQSSIPISVWVRNGRSFYIDSVSGSDSNVGFCPVANSTCNGPWQSASKAFSVLAVSPTSPSNNPNAYLPGDQILFKRGQIFTYSSSVTPAHWVGGITFGAYGSGNRPVIQPNAGWDGLIFNPASGDFFINFVDLEFKGQYPWSNGSLLFSGSGFNNILFLRVNITGYYNPLSFSGNLANAVSINDGVFIFNSTMYNSSLVMLSCYGCARVAIVDNNLDYSNNHIFYTDSMDRSFIYGNSFTRPAFGRTALRLSGGTNSYPSQNIYIAKNYFGGWVDPLNCFTMVGGCGGPGDPKSSHNGGGNRYNYLLVQFSPHANTTNLVDAVSEINYVIEDNIFANAETFMTISSAENITVRNNIFISNNTNGAPGSTTNVLKIGTSDSSVGGAIDQKPSKNINIIGNTFVQRNGANSIIRIENYSQPSQYTNPVNYYNHQNINIKDNIFYLASGANVITPAIMLDKYDVNLLNNISSDNNIFYYESGTQTSSLFNIGQIDAFTLGTNYNLSQWRTLTLNDVSSIYGNPVFTSYSTASLSNLNYLNPFSFGPNLVLQPNSPAIGVGASIPNLLFYDFNGKLRSANPTIGAYENLSAAIIPPTQTCNNGIIEGTETCEGTNFGVYGNGTILCSAYNSQYTSGNLACTNCQIDLSACQGSSPPVNGGNGGSIGGGGPSENTNPPTVYTSKSLTISGVILLNNQSAVCSNCNVNITFANLQQSLITSNGGNFTAIFSNINFTSGLSQIDVKLINSGVVYREYQKEIYISP